MSWNDVIDSIMMNEYAKYRNGLKRKENTMKEFTKKDLKNGDVVKLRDERVGIAIPDKDVIVYDSGYSRLSSYTDSLTHCGALVTNIDREMDIIAVRRPENSSQCHFNGLFNYNGELVYERKEVEEMTLEEVCKALGKEIKIVKSKE